MSQIGTHKHSMSGYSMSVSPSTNLRSRVVFKQEEFWTATFHDELFWSLWRCFGLCWIKKIEKTFFTCTTQNNWWHHKAREHPTTWHHRPCLLRNKPWRLRPPFSVRDCSWPVAFWSAVEDGWPSQVSTVLHEPSAWWTARSTSNGWEILYDFIGIPNISLEDYYHPINLG